MYCRGGASRSESKSIDCRGQSHHNSIGNLPPAPERTELLPMKNGNVPHCVIPTAASAEWRNPPRGRKNHHKVKSATWEDSSTPFHYARNDMSGVVPFIQTGCIRYGASPPPGLDGDESSPLHCVVPFTRTGCIRYVAGGRLPMKLRCDCHWQSIDFDSLRGAPPLRFR